MLKLGFHKKFWLHPSDGVSKQDFEKSGNGFIIQLWVKELAASQKIHSQQN